jgi:hypothetical protein
MRRVLFIVGLFTIALPGVLISSPALSSGLPKAICPQTVEPLAQLLVRDLPGYANRATIKGRSRSQSKELPHVVIASQPEVEPLEIPNVKLDSNLHQLFITTLERQTLGDRMYEFQQYHWLFLAKTRVGWRLAQSFSRTSRYPQDEQMTAIRNSSQGAIAQGIKTWLRDCNAGSLRL